MAFMLATTLISTGEGGEGGCCFCLGFFRVSVQMINFMPFFFLYSSPISGCHCISQNTFAY